MAERLHLGTVTLRLDSYVPKGSVLRTVAGYIPIVALLGSYWLCWSSRYDVAGLAATIQKMKITVLYVGSSLLAPLRNAEREINRAYGLDMRLAAYNFGAPFTEADWEDIESDLSEADIVFVIHVMDGENAARLWLAHAAPRG